MADLDVGLSGLGGKLKLGVSAVPPGGWVIAVALGAVAVLAYHFWDQDEEDGTDWMDPQQPPQNIAEPLSDVLGPLTARARRWAGAEPGAC
jgi:hypothetical protein